MNGQLTWRIWRGRDDVIGGPAKKGDVERVESKRGGSFHDNAYPWVKSVAMNEEKDDG